MQKNPKAFSSFSVNDIEKAKQFYGETLGLEVSDQMGGLNLHLANGQQTFIYPKPDHVPATYTTLNFLIDNIEEEVDTLTAAGITFEQYDTEYMKTDDKGISRMPNGPAMAWFKDPAGNFLSIIQEK